MISEEIKRNVSVHRKLPLHVFDELIKKCHDPDYELSEKDEYALKVLGYIDERSGKIPENVAAHVKSHHSVKR